MLVTFWCWWLDVGDNSLKEVTEKIKKEEQKIRETLARELSPDSSFQVCVTEGQYHPSHNKEDNMIEIPLHVYGHDFKNT